MTSEEDDGLIKRQITPDSTTTEHDFLEIIAELNGTPIDDLPSLYTQVGHHVETLFQDPPADEAQMEISFSYAGYRATIDQRGNVKLIRVKDSIGEN